jgi:hypothetical protein
MIKGDVLRLPATSLVGGSFLFLTIGRSVEICRNRNSVSLCFSFLFTNSHDIFREQAGSMKGSSRSVTAFSMTTANKQARKKEMKNTNEQKIPKTMLERLPHA